MSTPHTLVQTFIQAINEAPVEQYRSIISQVTRNGGVHLDQVICLLFLPGLGGTLGRMANHNPKSPDISRDKRIVHWLDACESLGADIHQALERKTATSAQVAKGSRALLHGTCYQVMDWMRTRGVENFLYFKESNEPTNFLSFSFYCGFPKTAEHLLDTAELTHEDLLWKGLFGPKLIQNSYKLATLLLKKGSVPPTGTMELLAKANINYHLLDKTLALAHILLEHDPSQREVSKSTANLAHVISKLQSPAGIDLMKFFLDLGADPMGKVESINNKDTPALSCLFKWASLRNQNQTRSTYWQAFGELFLRMDVKKQQELLNSHTVTSIIKALQRKSQDADPDIARIKKLALMTQVTENRQPDGPLSPPKM